jgi:hypothetical protein
MRTRSVRRDARQSSASSALPRIEVTRRPSGVDKTIVMIGFIVLGIVMLIWVLTWESEGGVEMPSEPGGPQDPRPAV